MKTVKKINRLKVRPSLMVGSYFLETLNRNSLTSISGGVHQKIVFGLELLTHELLFLKQALDIANLEYSSTLPLDTNRSWHYDEI